jgi:hypothetical protein
MNARAFAGAVAVAAGMLAGAGQAGAQSSSSSASAAPAGEGALSAGELDAMLASLARDALDERRAAVTAVVALGTGATPTIAKKLGDLRKGGDGGTYSAVKAARERAGGGAGFDLLEALVTAKPEASVTRALTTTCLVRALAHAGTTPAVRQMVLVASDAGGVMRPDLGRQM